VGGSDWMRQIAPQWVKTQQRRLQEEAHERRRLVEELIDALPLAPEERPEGSRLRDAIKACLLRTLGAPVMQPHLGEIYHQSPEGAVAWIHAALCSNPPLAIATAATAVEWETLKNLDPLLDTSPKGDHRAGTRGRIYLAHFWLTAEHVKEIKAGTSECCRQRLKPKQLWRLQEALRDVPADEGAWLRYTGQTYNKVHKRTHKSDSGPGALACYLGYPKLPLSAMLLPNHLDRARDAFNAAAAAAGRHPISPITSTGMGESLVYELCSAGVGHGNGGLNYTQAGLGRAHQSLAELSACQRVCAARLGIREPAAVRHLPMAEAVPASSYLPRRAGVRANATLLELRAGILAARGWRAPSRSSRSCGVDACLLLPHARKLTSPLCTSQGDMRRRRARRRCPPGRPP
jgi:hypothetical protein